MFKLNQPRRRCCREECECTIASVPQSQSNQQSNVNWLEPLSDCKVSKLQSEDLCINVVISLLRDKVEKLPKEYRTNTKIRQLWAQKENL